MEQKFYASQAMYNAAPVDSYPSNTAQHNNAFPAGFPVPPGPTLTGSGPSGAGPMPASFMQSNPSTVDSSAQYYAQQNNPGVTQYGTATNPQYGAQMFGYGAEHAQEFYNVQQKRGPPEPDPDDMDSYLASVEMSMRAPTTNQVAQETPPPAPTPATAPEKPVSLQDRLNALAKDKAEAADEPLNDPVMQSKAALLGPLPKKAKVVTQELDPSMFRRKSRFDVRPPQTNPFATGANAIPVGSTTSIVLNKYSISSSFVGTKRNPKRASVLGVKRREDGSIIIPENTCTVDIKIQRAIMQQLVGMIQFKFTIGINKLYNGITRNQKNKKKGDPWQITEEITTDKLLVWCEAMTHLVRIKKKRFIKLLNHVSPYIRAGVNLWAMFHGRGTRRIIRDNWHLWIKDVTPQSLGFDWEYFFLLVRSCYMSQDRRQRGKYRSKYKGVERYIIENVMWAPNKAVKFEKLWKELKCTFAIKKMAQHMVDWKRVIRYAISTVRYLITAPGDFITFTPKLKTLLRGIEEFLQPRIGQVSYEEIPEFEQQLKSYCQKHGGYNWEEWGITLPALIKLYNCINTTLHRPDPSMFAKPDVRTPFSKIHRTGFQEFQLPVQENKLGEPTIPAMVKRQLKKSKRKREKKEARLAEMIRAVKEKKEAEKEEEKARLLAEEKELNLEEENLPSNEDLLFKMAGVPTPREQAEMAKELDGEEMDVEDELPTIDDIEVSSEDEESFDFEPVYTYAQYVQPLASDTLYVIPGGSMLEDEIKLRVENHTIAPGNGYGLALSDTKCSVLFVFYPYARTMRCSYFTHDKHHHRVYADFNAAKSSLFQLTIKIKRNRFEVFTDGLLIKTVPAFMPTVGLSTAMVTGEAMPFVNFRVRRVSPSVPALPYLLKRRHQKGLLVTVDRHPTLGLVTRIGKVSGNVEMFVSHLRDMIQSVGNVSSDNSGVDNSGVGNVPSDNTGVGNSGGVANEAVGNTSENVETDVTANVENSDNSVSIDSNKLPKGKRLPQILVKDKKCVWIVGHHRQVILKWLKCIGF